MKEPTARDTRISVSADLCARMQTQDRQMVRHVKDTVVNRAVDL